jgi:hypothetical protein
MQKNNFSVSNRVVLLLALILLLLTIWSNWMLLDHITAAQLTGKASTGTVSICLLYTDLFKVILEKPAFGDVVGGNITLNTSIEYNPSYNIRAVEYYNDDLLIGNATSALSLNATYNSYVNLFDTLSLTDRNCYYEFSILVRANSSCDPIASRSNGRVSINNYDVEPSWNNFRNLWTTNFSALSNASALHEYAFVHNASIGISGVGLIHFPDETINFDAMNLDSHISVSHNRISIFSNNDNMRCLYLLNNSAPYNISLYNLTLANPAVMKNRAYCGSSCVITFSNQTEISFYINEMDDFTFSISEIPSFQMWDETDMNLSRHRKESVIFFVNYSNNYSSLPLNSPYISCKIRFFISGNFTPFYTMLFSNNSSLYGYNRSFETRNNYLWEAICNDSSDMYGPMNGTDYVNLTNWPPSFIRNISDQTWFQGMSLTGLNLNNYFNDSDDDTLTFSENLNLSYTPNIDVSITGEGIIIFTPQYTWYGVNFVVFNATDSIDIARSNTVQLVVQQQLQMPAEIPPLSGGGGGGGGGGGKCTPDWWCSPWSVCTRESNRTRSCLDLNNCGSNKGKPSEKESCTYVSACYNGFQDQVEDGIDCGGPCPPCATCSDQLLNCHHGSCEHKTDCGGPCPACPNCTDGIGNQNEIGIDCGGICQNNDCCNNTFFDLNLGEEDIDCGGPCKECEKPFIEVPKIIQKHRNMALITFIAILSLIFAFMLIRIAHPFISKYFAMLGWRIAAMRKRKTLVAPKQYNARMSLLEKLVDLEKKISDEQTDKLTNELFLAIRKYFKDIFQIDYEFSYEELIRELSRENIDPSLKMILASFFKKVSDIRFSGQDFSQVELQSLIDEARSIVRMTSKPTEDERQAELVSKKMKEQSMKLFGLDKIFSLISRAQLSVVKNDIAAAKNSYFKLIQEYNALPIARKEKVYDSIRRLYEEIKLFEKK